MSASRPDWLDLPRCPHALAVWGYVDMTRTTVAVHRPTGDTLQVVGRCRRCGPGFVRKLLDDVVEPAVPNRVVGEGVKDSKQGPLQMFHGPRDRRS